MNTVDCSEPSVGTIVGGEHFVTDGSRVILRVTRCRACGSSWFPARAQCSHCASRDLAAELTANEGTAYASTVVRVGPRRYPAPYTLAYVDVDGVRLLAHVVSEEALPPGTPVDLVLAAIGAADDGPVTSYAVTAKPAGGAR
jgi:scaffold protein (connect acetoacetyl-CoA thiolase and HMG-CoA synthase)